MPKKGVSQKMTKKKDRKTFFKAVKTEVAKEIEQAGQVETEETKQKQEMEQTVWSVRVGSQTLFKVYLDGRTRLDNMSAEENKKVGEALSEAISTVAKILEGRTTQHVVRKNKEITTVEHPDVERSEF